MADFLSQINDRYLRTYLVWLFSMLTSPSDIIRKTRYVVTHKTYGEYLLIIIVITTMIGITIGSMIPNRPPIQSRAIVFAVVSLLWIFLSLLVHFFCKLLGGKEKTEITMVLMVQNLAFAYVASTFLTLNFVWSFNTYDVTPRDAVKELIENPKSMIFSFQFLLLLYFVPMTVSSAHGFKGIAWVAVAVFSAVFAVLLGFPVYAQGSC